MILQSAVALLTGSGGFDVEDDVVGFEEGADVEAFELAVSDCCNSCIEFFVSGKFIDYIESVFAFCDGGIGPRVEDCHVEVVFLEGANNVDDFGVAHVGAVLLEGKAEDDDVAVEHLYAFLEHELDDAVGHVGAHAVVHAASGEDDFRVVAVALGALGEIVGVNAYAVATHKARLEGKEVPLGGSCFENVLGIDAHEGEYLRQLVDEGYIDVALRVFNHLCGFGNFNRGCEMSACGDNTTINLVDEFAYLGC